MEILDIGSQMAHSVEIGIPSFSLMFNAAQIYLVFVSGACCQGGMLLGLSLRVPYY